MPTGIPKNGKRAPRGMGKRAIGYTLKPGTASEQTQRLMEALADIEHRLQVEKTKDKARSALLAYAEKYGLTAADFREVAKLIGAREVGDKPVTSQNISTAKKMAVARKIKEARLAKGLTATEMSKRVGAKGTAAGSQWEHGMLPSLPKYRAALIKVLDLPANIFDEVGPPNNRGINSKAKRKAKANGHAHAAGA